MGFNLRDQYTGYLKKEDFPKPALLTIEKIEQVLINDDEKVVMHFLEMHKPMVLNRSNGELLCSLFGNDTDEMIGKQIVVYTDPNIMFGGRVVGGLRLRAPKPDSTKAKKNNSTPKPAPVDEDKAMQAAFDASADDNDDIPF